MRRYSGHSEEWGDFVDIKVNAPQVLRKQLERSKKGTVWVSSVCDPYQPLEKKYALTKRCLEELLNSQFPLYLQTKSALVIRDLDLLAEFRDIDVGFTITTDDEATARLFEPKASSVRDRIEALDLIHSKGIRTFVFIGPILPGDPKKLIGQLAGKVDFVYLDRMNYLSAIRNFFERHGLREATKDAFFERYKRALVTALRHYGITHELLF
jgi:DNA repair photolyase